MSDQLRENESGTRSAQRIVRKQVDKTLEALSTDAPLSDEAVHGARKRLKKARAILRLLREALGSQSYQHENACLRDASRPLTEVRDAKVLVDTFDELVKHGDGQVEEEALGRIRQGLLDRQREVRRQVLEEGAALALAKESLEAARVRAKEWSGGRRGWSVLGAGLKRVYRQGRDARAAAQQEPSTETLHEWRKQAKYLWQQLQVLQPLWPVAIEAMAGLAHELGDCLGDDHDLAVLREKLGSEPDSATADRLMGLIDRRRAELQEQAWALGARLYEEKPKGFARRLEACWRAWRASRRLAPA